MIDFKGAIFELQGGAFPGVYKIQSSLGDSWYSCKSVTYPFVHITVHKDEIRKASAGNSDLPYNHRY